MDPPPAADEPPADLLLPAVAGIIAIGAAVLLLVLAVATRGRGSRPAA